MRVCRGRLHPSPGRAQLVQLLLYMQPWRPPQPQPQLKGHTTLHMPTWRMGSSACIVYPGRSSQIAPEAQCSGMTKGTHCRGVRGGDVGWGRGGMSTLQGGREGVCTGGMWAGDRGSAMERVERN